MAADAGETVAVDVTIGPELRRKGIAREVIRLVQDARKNDGLDVSDRIWLRWSSADPEVSAALGEHAGLIAGEVLAVDYGPATDLVAGAPALAVEHADPDLGLTFWLRRA